MKKIALLAIGAALLGTAAQAQTVVVSPAERTQINQYVVKQKTAPVTLPSEVKLSVGTVLPETVELSTIEGVPTASRYRYVVVDGRTVLVEPGTRRVVEIID